MLSTAGLEIMNSISPEINWMSVTKGKRSKKSVARSSNGVAKAGNSSPKRVGDFSGSDSDKFREIVLEKSTSGKTKHVPIKKRRRALGSPSPQPRNPSMRPRDSFSPNLQSTSSLSKDKDQLPYPSRSTRRSLSATPNLQLRGVDLTATGKFGKWLDNEALSEQTEGEYFDTGDFSGIELLANAASMADADNANKDAFIVEDSSMPKSSDASTATLSKIGLKCNELENFPSCAPVHVENANCSLALNKCAALMSPRGSVKDVSAPECVSLKVDRRHWDLNVMPDAWVETYDEPTSENISQGVTDNDVHMEGMEERLEDHVPDESKENLPYEDYTESPKFKELSPTQAKNSSDISTEEYPNDNKLNQVLSSGADMGTSKQVTNTDRTLDVTLNEMLATELYASPDVVQDKEAKDSRKSFVAPGTFDQNVAGSTVADCQEQSNPYEIVAKHEDNDLSDEGSQRIILEDSCKSFTSGAQCDGPTSSVGKVGSTVDAPNDSGTSQGNHGHIVDGDEQSRIQEEYDSPPEDGELRGPYCCSWEENELELDLVDYESDGRNGGGSDVEEFFGSEIGQGGSEGSHGPIRRSLMTKRYPDDNGIESGSDKHSIWRRKDETKNNEMKESNGGSGTTVEQSMEIVVEENGDGVKREHLTGRTNATGGETLAREYERRMARGKLHSRVEGRSFFDATDGKDVSLTEQCRSRRLGSSYSHARNFSPGNHLGSFRPAAHVNERDGVDQWTKWGSRSHYTTGVDGRNHSKPRIVGDSAERFGGFDFNDQRQMANYQSNSLHRPFVRRRSPMDRDDCFDVRRRMPPTRGISSDRSRRQYPQGHSRDFGDDFQPMPDSTAASVRAPRYFSKTERSFSPNSVRGAHMPLMRRRYRSKSRTRSPKVWHSQRERNFSGRRHSRSPDFRSEARMERMRMPFSKPTFGSDYGGEAYMSQPPRARFCPHRNGRFVDNRNLAENHARHRGSPVRVFRRTQRFDSDGGSGNFQSDDYFRPMNRPKRFSCRPSEDRECKFETNYEDRKRDDIGELMHRRRQFDDSDITRRFRRDVGDDFETNNKNNEVDVRGSTMAQDHNDQEDTKRALQV